MLGEWFEERIQLSFAIEKREIGIFCRHIDHLAKWKLIVKQDAIYQSNYQTKCTACHRVVDVVVAVHSMENKFWLKNMGLFPIIIIMQATALVNTMWNWFLCMPIKRSRPLMYLHVNHFHIPLHSAHRHTDCAIWFREISAFSITLVIRPRKRVAFSTQLRRKHINSIFVRCDICLCVRHVFGQWLKS